MKLFTTSIHNTMDFKKILGIILILASLAVGYLGVNKISDNTKKAEILGVDFEVSKKSKTTEGYIFVGLAVVMFVGGIAMITKSK
jgi:hypothetical protein